MQVFEESFKNQKDPSPEMALDLGPEPNLFPVNGSGSSQEA